MASFSVKSFPVNTKGKKINQERRSKWAVYLHIYVWLNINLNHLCRIDSSTSTFRTGPFLKGGVFG